MDSWILRTVPVSYLTRVKKGLYRYNVSTYTHVHTLYHCCTKMDSSTDLSIYMRKGLHAIHACIPCTYIVSMYIHCNVLFVCHVHALY